MREPPHRWRALDARLPRDAAVAGLRAALRGPADSRWEPPPWLHPHQRDAARRLAGTLRVFSGALLADAPGLGKTHTALALAATYESTVVLVPATLRDQWHRTSRELDVPCRIQSHESLSRGARLHRTALVVVDEAHRFRTPTTRRYDALARGVRDAHLLLLTATPVVNAPDDLVALLRLFLADHALAPFGVPSLADAPRRPLAALFHALLPLVVARDAGAAGLADHLPRPSDASVRRLPCASADAHRAIVCGIEALTFPPLPDAQRLLLRRHLLLRLASSREALDASLRRHLRYVDAATRALRSGAPVPRRVLPIAGLDADEAQLEFAWPVKRDPDARLTALLASERDRLTTLRAMLGECGVDPKRQALSCLLERERGSKVLIFATARATAVALGAALRWHRVAVATSSGARIASGPIPVRDVLARFAPTGQRFGPVPSAMRLDVLIATDLASEGLNLQDADALIHYDLPWNPLRLAQRLGRIARLGSEHHAVRVSWFAPAEDIEHRLRQEAIIERKLRAQLALAVPVSGRVGGGGVLNAMLVRRETLARETPVVPGYAVWAAPLPRLCVLRWDGASGSVRELVGLAGGEPLAHDLGAFERHPTVAAPVPPPLAETVTRMARARTRLAGAAPPHPGTLTLARAVLRHARLAGIRRDRTLLGALDDVLTRLREGVTVGAERQLSDRLARPRVADLRAWLRDHPARKPVFQGPAVEVVLVGGSASNARRAAP